VKDAHYGLRSQDQLKFLASSIQAYSMMRCVCKQLLAMNTLNAIVSFQLSFDKSSSDLLLNPYSIQGRARYDHPLISRG